MKFSTPLLFLLSTLPLTLAKHDAHKNDYDGPARNSLERWTDNMVFTRPISTFYAEHKARVVEGVDGVAGVVTGGWTRDVVWETDACSHADDRPLGWDFKPSCTRHDFAHRNYVKQGRWSKGHKKQIDKNFKYDMLAQCDVEDGSRTACRAMAKMYYGAVKTFGKRKRGMEFARGVEAEWEAL